MRNTFLGPIFCTGLSLLAAACSSSASNSNAAAGGEGGTSTDQVLIYSWWIAPGEAESLQALVDVNKVANPDDSVYNAAIKSGSEAKKELAARMADGDPPDLFQGNAHDLPAFVKDNPGALEPLDDFLKEKQLDSAILPEILQNVTVDGAVYAMPVNIHRENALLFNKSLFAASGLEAPTTTAEFLSACATLKAAGVTPVATSYQGWILRIMFNSLAMGSMGTATFHDYMAGGARDDAAFGAAVDLMTEVLTNYINADAGDAEFGWTQAADAVQSGQAAMFFHGDWAKGYFVQMGWTPGTDFGVVASPGSADMFWYGVDDFSMPKGGPNAAGAWRFLETVASKDGQVAFNKRKGSTPIRSDIPVTQLDSEGQVTFADFKAANYKMLVVGKDAWDNAWAQFATDHDKAALMQVYADNPPTAK